MTRFNLATAILAAALIVVSASNVEAQSATKDAPAAAPAPAASTVVEPMADAAQPVAEGAMMSTVVESAPMAGCNSCGSTVQTYAAPAPVASCNSCGTVAAPVASSCNTCGTANPCATTRTRVRVFQNFQRPRLFRRNNCCN